MYRKRNKTGKKNLVKNKTRYSKKNSAKNKTRYSKTKKIIAGDPYTISDLWSDIENGYSEDIKKEISKNPSLLQERMSWTGQNALEYATKLFNGYKDPEMKNKYQKVIDVLRS